MRHPILALPLRVFEYHRPVGMTVAGAGAVAAAFLYRAAFRGP